VTGDGGVGAAVGARELAVAGAGGCVSEFAGRVEMLL
jgi:hypothetical protein